MTAPDAFEPAPAISTPEPTTLRRLFFGDDGLRAGWSFALFLVLAILFITVFNVALVRSHAIPPPNHASATSPLQFKTSFLGELAGVAALLLAALVMSGIERRPFARYGLPVRRAIPDFLLGLLWGLILLSALIGTLFLTHNLSFDAVLLHGTPALTNGLLWALGFLAVGLQEEFATRGYVQYTVARGISGIARGMDPGFRHAHALGFWVSASIFSILIFMGLHLFNPGETAPGILAVGAAGALFAFSLYRTGSLWWASGFHTAWDWSQSFLYGVPDSGLMVQNHLLATHPVGVKLLSGGSTGPEASILVLPTLALGALVVHLTLPRRNYPLTPDQQPIQQPAANI